MTLEEAVAWMRDACTGWPQPNSYDRAMDVIEAELRRLKDGPCFCGTAKAARCPRHIL